MVPCGTAQIHLLEKGWVCGGFNNKARPRGFHEFPEMSHTNIASILAEHGKRPSTLFCCVASYSQMQAMPHPDCVALLVSRCNNMTRLQQVIIVGYA